MTMCYWWDDEWWLIWLWYVFLKYGFTRLKWLIVLNANCDECSDVTYLIKYMFDDDYEDDLMIMIYWWWWFFMMNIHI